MVATKRLRGRVTKTDLRWLHSDLGTSELSGLVSDLQCGLIAAAWYDDAGAESCRAVLGAAPRRDVADNVLAETLPFDLARAHALYKELFGQAEDLIRNKRLIVVPSRALAQLPLQVLVTGLSDPEAARPRAKQVTRLGAELLDIQEDARRQLRLRPNEGVLVHRPVVGGPADRAGVRAYDVLLSISGTSVASVEAATKFIRSRTPQTKVVLRLLRADKENQIKEIQITVTAEAWTYWEWTPHIVDAAGLRNVSWLARSHSTMILPTVNSLSALRRFAKPSAATKPMIGFGNPLLDGNPRERPWEAGWAAEARAKQVCDVTAGQQTAHVARRLRTVDRMTIRGGRVDIDALRSQVPLPDTADELCVSASILKLTSADVVLGSNATETMVKRLSAEGRLADYRILHFATHGALAGEIENVNEPGLILTPPPEQSEGDDGYLSASEITKLKLDANLVILSACNTAVVSEGAAGDNNNWRESEAQLGLAFAFFYAGARALLVSNWAVDSAATVKLVTGTVEADARTADVGRAEALRRAMLAMIDNGEERDAHPSLWAPFVVFGEGAPYR